MAWAPSVMWASKTVMFGRYYIAGEEPGLLTVDHTPAARTVLCYDARSHHLVSKSVSAADGTFRIEHLAGNRLYRLVAVDDMDQKQADVVDRIAPVPMAP